VSVSAQALAVLQRALQEAPQLLEREMTAAATEATILVEREVKENIPRGATGLTAGSVTSDVFSTPAGVLGVVGSSQPAALFIELGTRGGARKMPPPDALVPWIRAKRGLGEKEAKSAAFALARHIQKHGTKPQRPFARAADSTAAEVTRIYEEALARVGVQLAGGAA
jgi:hypothetical protein